MLSHDLRRSQALLPEYCKTDNKQMRNREIEKRKQINERFKQ